MLYNCSGKHAAMLVTCIVNDWPTETYLSPEHPLQVHIRRTIEELAREPIAAVGVDGCGAPLFALTLGGLARAFRALVLAEPGSPERKVADAMRKFPEWTSGTTRDENKLMTAIPGLLLKAGAEGVDAFALPDGTAAAVKIDDGNARARTPVTVAILAMLGAQPPVELATTEVTGGGQQVGVIRATRLALTGPPGGLRPGRLRQACGVRGQGEAGLSGGLARGESRDDLAEQRRELRAVARAGRGDHERAAARPVEDEVLVRGPGVKAGHLVDRAARRGRAPAWTRSRAPGRATRGRRGSRGPPPW